jgi:hypothetical protein
MARAIDRPSDVFPTPGGPTKHMIDEPLGCSARALTSLRTARNSRIRSLTLAMS